ncbi:hypothetical protein STRCI_005857 [Streptomyces cinnabarinus]|uniref:Integral membrane protein n=1 Tax=Streptomyces cinnabarinus TaxID=67287 RepID=A0ABY7KLH1_9ACTN|nr:hypothetical protein [Streptomyces cinnabarinus]WAZ24438.1 hypothetical protein STRCI_005857 [Streptomyces cinnabarinus]
MLALRLTRRARPAVQLRRLLVASASAGTGFLLLCALGHAMTHPGSPGTSFLRLTWCAAPLAATVHFAVAVSRTDPGTRPRPGLAAIGLGPYRLMAVSATTTALSTLLGSMLALLFFLHLRGDLTGMPFDGAAADFLAASEPLPLPAALTLLTLVPAAASLAVAFTVRPRETKPPAEGPRRYGRFGAYGGSGARETFGAYGRFGARMRRTEPASSRAATVSTEPAGSRVAEAAPDAPTAPPSGLPWGTAILAAGLAVEAYASTATTPSAPMPGGLPTGPAAVLVGWALTAIGLALAGPGLTHLCGRLLQSLRPGALRLLAGRVLMEEATRIGRPLGVVCAVASAAYAMAVLHDPDADGRALGPLTTLGATVVTGCAVATLITAAVEARQARAGTTAALLRLGAPPTTLRGAAALRAGALLAAFGPLTLVVAELAALPLAR